MIRSYLIAMAILLMAVSPGFAAKKLALVIGNDAYTSVPKLQKAVNDARAVSDTMKRIGFDVDLGENLNRREINARFASFVDRIGPGDTAFFFFAGHGVAIAGQNILLPVDVPADGNEGLIRSEAHVVDEFLEAVKAKGALVSFFVLDACRNNPFATRGAASAERAA